MVYLVHGNKLHAFNGIRLYWTITIGSDRQSSPAAATGVIYVSADRLYAFDAATGATLHGWPVAANAIWSSPAVAGKKVYVASNHKLYTFNAANADQLWDSGTTIEGNMYCIPAVVNDRVYVTAIVQGRGMVYAFKDSSSLLPVKGAEPYIFYPSRTHAHDHAGHDDGSHHRLSRAQPEGTQRLALRGKETILPVEDEPDILSLSTMLLDRQGYTVFAASSPGEAMRLAQEHVGEIHLLMTDVVMPEMNGRDLAKKPACPLSAPQASVHVGIYGRCHRPPRRARRRSAFHTEAFLHKSLAAKVREVLNQE